MCSTLSGPLPIEEGFESPFQLLGLRVSFCNSLGTGELDSDAPVDRCNC